VSDRVTLAQVAEEADVSAMTVSNVLHGKPGASEETRRRVMEAVDRLGYVPHAAARSLKGGRTGLIGVLTFDLTSQYGLEIVRGIADELVGVEFEALINASYHDAQRERDRIEFMTRGLVDGLLLIAPVVEEQTLSLLRKRRTPAVVIDPRQLDLDLPRVTVDNYQGVRAGTEHLIALGHEHIAYIGGLSELDSTAVRFQGYQDAIRLAGLRVDDALVDFCDFTYASGFRIASRLIEEHPLTAIQTGADLIAFGALDAARKHGLRVPEDISVLGFDDLPQATQSFPGLTTVRQPLHDMGQTAVRVLMPLIDGTTPMLSQVQMQTSLIVRGTTAAPTDGRS